MKSDKKILVAALIACLGFGGSYAYAEEADTEPVQPVQAAEGEEKPEVKTINYGVNISFKPLANNEGTHDYENIIGAVITLTNKETQQVYEYTTDGDGAHQHIPYGTYTMHLVSVPEEYKDRFEWPADQEFEARGWSGYRGFNVEEKEKQEPQPEPQPDPDDKPDDKPEEKPSDEYEYDFYLPSKDDDKEEDKKEENKEEESKDDRSDDELAKDIIDTDKKINDTLDKNEENKKEEDKKEDDKKPSDEKDNKPEKGKKEKDTTPAKNGNPKTGVASVGYLGGLAAISMAGIVASIKRK